MSSTQNGQKARKTVSSLKDEINECIQELNKVPDFSFGNMKSSVVVEKFSNELLRITTRLEDVERVEEAVDEIRNEIINPVNEIIASSSKQSQDLITASAKQSEKWGWLGFVIGILGLLVTLIQLFPLISGATTTASGRSNEGKIIKTGDSAGAGKKGLTGALEFVSGISGKGKITLSASQTLKELEDGIANGKMDAAQIEVYKSKLSDILKNADRENIDDGETIPSIFYGIMLCYHFQSSWDDILALRQLVKNSGISEGKYGAAMEVYKAYAQYMKTNDVQSLLSEIDKVASIESGLTFLAPSSRQKTTITAYFQGQKAALKDINQKQEEKKLIQQFTVWVYGADKTLARVEKVVADLKAAGFNNAVAKNEPWNRVYDDTIGYYKNQSFADGILQRSIGKVIGAGAKYTYVGHSESVLVKNIMASAPDVQLVIVLGVKAPRKTSFSKYR